jgi:hypothetical protein
MTFNGTSSSTPLTAGAIAVLLSKYWSLYVEDVEHVLEAACRDVSYDGVGGGGLWGYDIYSGWGRIDLGRSLRWLDAPAEAPYELVHEGDIGGSYSVGYENTGGMSFTAGEPYNCYNEYMSSGHYQAHRYDVRVDVVFDQEYVGDLYENDPHVWGVGLLSSGWSGMNPNFRIGWAGVVDGTVTRSGCQMQTFVYRLFTGLGQPIGWWPCRPEEVTVGYGLLGIPADVVDEVSKENQAERTERAVRIVDRGHEGVRFAIHGRPGDEVKCSIFEVGGRRVTDVVSTALVGSKLDVDWDGKNEDGEALGSGVYFVKVLIGPFERTQKILRWR